ncbi:MAG: dTMP kinase [Bacteroidetes bacterium]|nr:dTMP kinase [Bacteroidota bacterium]
MFVTVEGLDFCGKSTQTRKLVERLEQKHAEDSRRWPAVRFLREPGGTAISERLRKLLLDRASLEMSDLTELLLFSASRAQLVAEVIQPSLKSGEVVVCDRFYDSTTAYQGYGRELDIGDIRHINVIATAGLSPDLTILIDISVDEIFRRKADAGLRFDRMEESGRDFYERVRKGYHALAREDPDRIIVVDGMDRMDGVERNVWNIVVRKMMVVHESE